MKLKNEKMKQTLCITGCARSGTTALGLLLNADKNIHITHEKLSLVRNPNTQSEYSNTSKKIIGDKHPEYLYCIESVLKNYPDCKFIFTFRQCKDFVKSSNRHAEVDFNGEWVFKNKVSPVMYWVRHNKILLKYINDGLDCFIFPYEYYCYRVNEFLDRFSEYVGYNINIKNPESIFKPTNVSYGEEIKSKLVKDIYEELYSHFLRTNNLK